jgi:hypothetical protein
MFANKPVYGKEVIYVPTGKKAASDAGKVLADPKATPAEKTAAASDLAQTPKHGGTKK